MPSRSYQFAALSGITAAAMCAITLASPAQAQLFTGWSGGGAASVQSRPLRMRSSPGLSAMRYSPGFRAFGRWRPYSWSNSDQSRGSDNDWNGSYRTLCVRLCDGYFFPISYRASRSRMHHDAKVCEASCDCEARLFYLPSSSSDVKSATDLTGQSYGRLEHAFEYKLTYDPSCSCRPAPWAYPEQSRHEQYAEEAAQNRTLTRDNKGKELVALLEREDAKDERVAAALLTRFEERAKKLAAPTRRALLPPPATQEPIATAEVLGRGSAPGQMAANEPADGYAGDAEAAIDGSRDAGAAAEHLAGPGGALAAIQVGDDAPLGEVVSSEMAQAAAPDADVATEQAARKAPAAKRVTARRSARPSSNKAAGSKTRGFWQM